MDTRLRQTSFYYRQFALSQGKESPYIYLNSTLFKALSPSIHIQILQTDLHTFPLRMSFYLGDHFNNSHNLSVDNVWILLGEN